jgi:hypothetical protein
MLCGKIDTNERNRVDYSATNAPDVWNGEDSSFGPTGALYFGEGGELTAAAALYNRVGSNLYDMAVFCKHSETYILTGYDQETWKIYTLSKAIGCPAPLTMTTADIGIATSDEGARNIALWLSYKGPVLFDGNSIIHQGAVFKKPYFIRIQVIISDHGNAEDMEIGDYTLNPVSFFLNGPPPAIRNVTKFQAKAPGFFSCRGGDSFPR